MPMTTLNIVDSGLRKRMELLPLGLLVRLEARNDAKMDPKTFEILQGHHLRLHSNGLQ
jgi:hypothetical protein